MAPRLDLRSPRLPAVSPGPATGSWSNGYARPASSSPTPRPPQGATHGRTLVITGTLPTGVAMRARQLSRWPAAGVSSAVSKKTSYIVVSEGRRANSWLRNWASPLTEEGRLPCPRLREPDLGNFPYRTPGGSTTLARYSDHLLYALQPQPPRQSARGGSFQQPVDQRDHDGHASRAQHIPGRNRCVLPRLADRLGFRRAAISPASPGAGWATLT